MPISVTSIRLWSIARKLYGWSSRVLACPRFSARPDGFTWFRTSPARRSLTFDRHWMRPSDSIPLRKARAGPINLATAYRQVGDWDAAEKANQEALALKPDPGSLPALQLNQAAIATGRGRTEEARLIYEQTIASNAVNPGVLWQAHAGLARLALAAGDWERASQLIRGGNSRRGTEPV